MLLEQPQQRRVDPQPPESDQRRTLCIRQPGVLDDQGETVPMRGTTSSSPPEGALPGAGSPYSSNRCRTRMSPPAHCSACGKIRDVRKFDGCCAECAGARDRAWERDFIDAYLRLQNSKRDEYAKRWDHRRMYLNIRENDSSTKFEDLAPDQPGDFWRTEAQQKG